MRKILTTFLAVAMLATMSLTAFAAANDTTINEGSAQQSGNTTVQYGVESSYTVTIPDTIAISSAGEGAAVVTATDVMIPSQTTLSVALIAPSYVDGEYYAMTNADNAKLHYNIQIEGADLVPAAGNSAQQIADGAFLQIEAGEMPTGTETVNLDFALTEEVEQAGTYSDTITFAVSVA